ncbi:hypothetical protein WP50_09025, partial [Lactiplantibacillus plantarum]
QTVEQMVDRIQKLPERTKLQILSPIVRQKKGEHKKIFEKIKREGFVRVRVDGDIHDISETFELNKNHSIPCTRKDNVATWKVCQRTRVNS